MATQSTLIIRDANGSIIAAQAEEPAGSEYNFFITPADPQHTLHRVSDVPEEIWGLADPAEFQKAITAHVTSAGTQIDSISADDLYAGSKPQPQ